MSAVENAYRQHLRVRGSLPALCLVDATGELLTLYLYFIEILSIIQQSPQRRPTSVEGEQKHPPPTDAIQSIQGCRKKILGNTSDFLF